MLYTRKHMYRHILLMFAHILLMLRSLRVIACAGHLCKCIRHLASNSVFANQIWSVLLYVWHRVLSSCILIYDLSYYICGIKFYSTAFSNMNCVTVYDLCGIKFYPFALSYMSYVVHRNTLVHPPYMLPLLQWLVIAGHSCYCIRGKKQTHMHSHHICWHCAY